MDLFEQLSQIDEQVATEQEKRFQEQLFSTKQKNHPMDFLVEEMIWQEVELERAQKVEAKKLKPLSAGFGPWSW